MANKKIFHYKGIKVNRFGVPIFNVSKNKKVRNRRIYNISFQSFFKDSDPKNLIVLYDIPDSLKKERDWFRRHLIKFGYEMIQRSVWVGPSPLPKHFLDYLDEIKIGDKFKTFKLAKSYDSSISAMA